MNYYDEYINDYDYTGILHKDHLNNFSVNDNIVENNRGIHNDIVCIKDNKVVNIKKRDIIHISGILYLHKNTKYGFNSKNNPYYIFKPLNNKYPNFLVPSNIKNQSKNYIVIQFNKWPIESKYPYGQVLYNIGPIGSIDNEYKILLHKHNLVYPKLKIPKTQIEKDSNINITNSDYSVFSIDPIGCKDIDDAISFIKKTDFIEIGVHITDVCHYINSKHLLNNLTSSIYYSDKQINMIPDIYSTNICSLLENTYKKCISVLFKFSYDYKLIDYTISLTNVFVEKNFSYDEAEKHIKYKSNKYKYLCDLMNFMNHYDSSINDTHILIEKLMILTNHKIALTLYNYDSNIILRTHKKTDIYTEKSNNELNKFLQLKKFTSAIYEQNNTNIFHYGLNLEFYTHFTSPIRRLVDIITHINVKNYLLKKPLLHITNSELEHINKIQKNIKKFSYDCNIINLLFKYPNHSSIKTYAYIIDFTNHKFTIYIPQYNMEYKIKYYSNKLDNLYKIIESSEYLKVEYNNIETCYYKYERINIEIYFIYQSEYLKDKLKIIIDKVHM